MMGSASSWAQFRVAVDILVSGVEGEGIAAGMCARQVAGCLIDWKWI